MLKQLYSFTLLSFQCWLAVETIFDKKDYNTKNYLSYHFCLMRICHKMIVFIYDRDSHI